MRSFSVPPCAEFQNDTADVLKPESYCQQFGFQIRTVQRWAERLLDSSSFDVEFHERVSKVCRIIEMEQAEKLTPALLPRQFTDQFPGAS